MSLFPQFNVAPLPALAQHALMAGIFLLIALTWYVLLLSGLVGGSGAVLAGVGGTILTKTLVSA